MKRPFANSATGCSVVTLAAPAVEGSAGDRVLTAMPNAETAEDRAVNRHAHIEYLHEDDYRSPESMPLVIGADWPEPM